MAKTITAKDVKLARTAAFAAMLFSGACVSAGGRPTSNAIPPIANDSSLFRLALSHIIAEPFSLPTRVDARPLANDPRIVTLHPVYRVVPERVSSEALQNVFADVPQRLLATRRDLLSRLGIRETDGMADAQCPGAMIPPSARIDAERQQRCPQERFRSVMIALPREGGSYWPSNFDDREKYLGRTVWTVRVIERDVGPSGSAETSRDFVFDCAASEQCELLEIRHLLVVE